MVAFVLSVIQDARDVNRGRFMTCTYATLTESELISLSFCGTATTRAEYEDRLEIGGATATLRGSRIGAIGSDSISPFLVASCRR